MNIIAKYWKLFVEGLQRITELHEGYQQDLDMDKPRAPVIANGRPLDTDPYSTSARMAKGLSSWANPRAPWVYVDPEWKRNIK